MNIELCNRTLQAAGASKLAIADCDIHQSPKLGIKGIYPYLPQRWRQHLAAFGPLARQAFQSGPAYPKSQPDASRRDSWPPDGSRPGSDLDFMRRHHLDANDIALGVLNMIRPHPGSFQNFHLAGAVCQVMNRWQIAEWTEPEPRLKASILVPYEDGEASAREIERYAGDGNFVQVLLLSRTAEPLGSKGYWPIYAAAAEAGLPVGIHAFGFGGFPVTGGGWPSFYLEDMAGHAQSQQSMLTSMVFEGIFERWPTLKIVLIEAGFAWLPSLAWRLDRLWHRLRAETPHVKRPPSSYIRDHVWLTTQPMEEPQPREHVLDAIDWIGWDRLVFATDYPHWDYDDPTQVLPFPIDDARRQQFFIDNARTLYKNMNQPGMPQLALVTGAGSGLGRATAMALAQRGCRVALVDVDAASAEAVARECGDAHQVIVQDLAAHGGAETAVAHGIAALGGLSIVVNNAGFGAGEAFLEMREETWDRTLDLNLKAVALICAAAGRHMREHGGGRIVNVTSPASRMALPNYLAYAASKAGVDAVTRAAAVALAPFGVTVNSVAPGMMDTPMQRITERQLAAIEGRNDIEIFLDERTRRIPMGRRTDCETVASTIVWLALDAPDYITAARLNASGGLDRD